VDTYNTLNSGVLNYLCVAAAIIDAGYQPLGIRLDSGDLAVLSMFKYKLNILFIVFIYG
jgi:nicotinate phosphoribosyltransferase